MVPILDITETFVMKEECIILNCVNIKLIAYFNTLSKYKYFKASAHFKEYNKVDMLKLYDHIDYISKLIFIDKKYVVSCLAYLLL